MTCARALLTLAILLAPSLLLGQEPTPRRVSYRESGGVYFEVPGEVKTVGEHIDRVEILIHNEASSQSDIVCGYDPVTLSTNPGPGTGDRLAPGEGKVVCAFADKPLYCVSVTDPATLYYDEARMVTPTPAP